MMTLTLFLTYGLPLTQIQMDTNIIHFGSLGVLVTVMKEGIKLASRVPLSYVLCTSTWMLCAQALEVIVKSPTEDPYSDGAIFTTPHRSLAFAVEGHGGNIFCMCIQAH